MFTHFFNPVVQIPGTIIGGAVFEAVFEQC